MQVVSRDLKDTSLIIDEPSGVNPEYHCLGCLVIDKHIVSHLSLAFDKLLFPLLSSHGLAPMAQPKPDTKRLESFSLAWFVVAVASLTISLVIAPT